MPSGGSSLTFATNDENSSHVHLPFGISFGEMSLSGGSLLIFFLVVTFLLLIFEGTLYVMDATRIPDMCI